MCFETALIPSFNVPQSVCLTRSDVSVIRHSFVFNLYFLVGYVSPCFCSLVFMCHRLLSTPKDNVCLLSRIVFLFFLFSATFSLPLKQTLHDFFHLASNGHFASSLFSWQLFSAFSLCHSVARQFSSVPVRSHFSKVFFFSSLHFFSLFVCSLIFQLSTFYDTAMIRQTSHSGIVLQDCRPAQKITTSCWLIKAVSVFLYNHISHLCNGIADEMQRGDTVWRMRIKWSPGGLDSAIIGGELSRICASPSVLPFLFGQYLNITNLFKHSPGLQSRGCGLMRHLLSERRHLMSHQSFWRHRVASLRDALPSLAVGNFPGGGGGTRLESSHLWYLIGPFCHGVISINECHLHGK